MRDSYPEKERAGEGGMPPLPAPLFAIHPKESVKFKKFLRNTVPGIKKDLL